jgi:hypothetical protein
MFNQASKQSQGGGTGVEMVAPLLDAGSYPARLVQIVDLGMQPGSSMYPEPKLKMEMRFELLDEFMEDKEGKELENKPRWFSYELTYNADGYMGDRSNIYKVFDALNGFEKHPKDLLGTPCNVAIAVGLKKDGKTKKNKITGVSAMREKDAVKAPELQNPTLYFSLMEPDMDAWAKLSSKGQWSQQNKIKTSLEIRLTPLAKLIGLDGEANGSEESDNESNNESTSNEAAPEEDNNSGTELSEEEKAAASGGGKSVTTKEDEDDPFN